MTLGVHHVLKRLRHQAEGFPPAACMTSSLFSILKVARSAPNTRIMGPILVPRFEFFFSSPFSLSGRFWILIHFISSERERERRKERERNGGPPSCHCDCLSYRGSSPCCQNLPCPGLCVWIQKMARSGAILQSLTNEATFMIQLSVLLSLQRF